MSNSVEWMGYLARTIGVASTFPKVLERLIKAWRHEASFSLADLCRDAALALSNAIWAWTWAVKGVHAITVFCLLNCALLITLSGLNIWSRFRTRR